MVKPALLFSALTLLLAAVAPAAAQDRPSLAVFQPLVAEAVRARFQPGKLDAQELARQIEEGIRASRRFSVFERTQEVLRTVRIEQEFAAGEQSLGNAAEAGRLNNVQYIVQPLISHVSVSVQRLPNEMRPGQYVFSATGSATVSAKVLDTTSGEIVYQVTREAELRRGGAGAARQTGENDAAVVEHAAWRALSADLGAKFTASIVGALFPLQVIQAQGADIFVNRGEGPGLAVGDVYQLFAVGAALIDPVTKETLGEAESLLGEVEIIRVTPKFSVARAKVALVGAPKPGDVLRPRP